MTVDAVLTIRVSNSKYIGWVAEELEKKGEDQNVPGFVSNEEAWVIPKGSGSCCAFGIGCCHRRLLRPQFVDDQVGR
jgi:hypothetical protein